MDITFANGNIMLVDGSFLQASDVTSDDLRQILRQAEIAIIDAFGQMLFNPHMPGRNHSLKSILVARLTPSLKNGLRAAPQLDRPYRMISDIHPRFHDYWLAASLPMLKPEAQIMSGLPELSGLCLAVSHV